LFVPAKLHDKFVSDLAAMAQRIPMGNPLDAKTQLGPLMTAQRLDDILAQIEVAKTAGARVFSGGKKETRPDLSKGNFVRPTILTNVTPDMAIARDELFGPVLLRFARASHLERRRDRQGRYGRKAAERIKQSNRSGGNLSIHAAIKSNKERRVISIEEVLESSLRPLIQRQAATERGDQTLRFA
jgi:hypothetical protein